MPLRLAMWSLDVERCGEQMPWQSSDEVPCKSAWHTARRREKGTGISEASKTVPIFPYATLGGTQVSS